MDVDNRRQHQMATTGDNNGWRSWRQYRMAMTDSNTAWRHRQQHQMTARTDGDGKNGWRRPTATTDVYARWPPKWFKVIIHYKFKFRLLRENLCLINSHYWGSDMTKVSNCEGNPPPVRGYFRVGGKGREGGTWLQTHLWPGGGLVQSPVINGECC